MNDHRLRVPLEKIESDPENRQAIPALIRIIVPTGICLAADAKNSDRFLPLIFAA